MSVITPRMEATVPAPMAGSTPHSLPDLAALLALFHAAAADVGDFQEVAAADLPPVERRLLAHDQHMTVSVESHHGGPVDVQVLARLSDRDSYAREILLVRRSDGQVVQYGVMRIQWGSLAPRVRAEIESESTPLGHVLIRHNVLRKIHLSRLWRITPGPVLRTACRLEDDAPLYGRTASIECDGVPAVELLEVVCHV